MYRPMVLGFCLILILYYFIVGCFVMPFLEGMRVSVIMVPLRFSLCIVAGAAFYLVRRTENFVRLELVALVIGLQMFGTLFINESIEFRAAFIGTFQLIVILMGAVCPSLRVWATNVIAGVTAWLWLVSGHTPELLRQNIGMVLAGVVASGLIWGLINQALRNARHALRVAEQRGDELERFAYICSHDMQEPVRMMHAYSGLLAETTQGKLDEDSRRYLGYIQLNAVRMQQMIRDILTFSQVGRSEVTIGQVDAAEVVSDVLARFASVIGETGAKVVCEDLPHLETSETLLHLVFQNLIGNALKYQDGRCPPEITIRGRAEKSDWRFEVQDNGIGIDPAHRAKVFALFQRLNRKEDYPGTGIGLSTCRKFLHLYGGEIDFHSAPGEGSTFYFTLPRTPPVKLAA